MKTLFPKIIFSLTILLNLTGCKTIIVKNQTLMTYSDIEGAPDRFNEYKSLEKFEGTVKEQDDILIISPANKNDIQSNPSRMSDDKSIIEFIGKAKLAPEFGQLTPLQNSVSYPKFFFDANSAEKFLEKKDWTFKYRQTKHFLQALTIPVRFRAKIDSSVTDKTIKVNSQVESSPSLVLAYGFKASWNKFKGEKNIFGSPKRTHSVAFGVFSGLSIVDVNKNTTRYKVAENKASKNLAFPTGIAIVYGLNSVNIGYAYGIDIITGPNRLSWNYFGKPWHGIVIGLDIIK